MSADVVHAVRVERLINRRVHDADGRVVGRLEEMCAEVQLTDHGADYVVTEFHVGTHALVESLAGGQLARAVAHVLGRGLGYRRYVIPWEWMDLTDPHRPRVTKPLSELRVED